MNIIRSLFCILALSGCAVGATAQDKPPAKPTDYNYLLPWAGKGAKVADTKEGQTKAPFQMFDNVYYVGPQGASTYILKTEQGLILIDPAFDYTADTVLDNIRSFGFKPTDIKYILITHGHWDHTAGVKAIQKASGARVGMAAGDWTVYHTPLAAHPFETISDDLVLKEGDVIELGTTTVRLHVTPGHTPGCLTMVYTVYDHGKPYEAMSLGGTGFNSPPGYSKIYIDSMKRMREIPNIEVLLPDHQEINSIFELEQKLKSRKPGDPNPFVLGRAGVLTWFDTILKQAEERLRLETAAMQK